MEFNMKYCVTIELESKAEANEIIERLPLERPVYISGVRPKGSYPIDDWERERLRKQKKYGR
jgi:hypothetical protein